MAETVIAAWRDRHNVHSGTTPRIWLHQIAAHVCIEAIEHPPPAER